MFPREQTSRPDTLAKSILLEEEVAAQNLGCLLPASFIEPTKRILVILLVSMGGELVYRLKKLDGAFDFDLTGRTFIELRKAPHAEPHGFSDAVVELLNHQEGTVWRSFKSLAFSHLT